MKDIVNLIESVINIDAVQMFIVMCGAAIIAMAIIGTNGYMSHLERQDKIEWYNATNKVNNIKTNE